LRPTAIIVRQIFYGPVSVTERTSSVSVIESLGRLNTHLSVQPQCQFVLLKYQNIRRCVCLERLRGYTSD